MVSMSMSWRLVVFLVVIASCEFGGGERWRDSRAVAVKNMQVCAIRLDGVFVSKCMLVN